VCEITLLAISSPCGTFAETGRLAGHRRDGHSGIGHVRDAGEVKAGEPKGYLGRRRPESAPRLAKLPAKPTDKPPV